MSRVRFQKLPLLPTEIMRAYPERDMPLMAPFQLVTTLQLVDIDAMWVHGMHGVSNLHIWRAMGEELLGRDIRFLHAMRAPGRILPGGETQADGSVVIDLESLLRRPRDTGFSEL